jgi:hypothetical protein
LQTTIFQNRALPGRGFFVAGVLPVPVATTEIRSLLSEMRCIRSWI